MIDGKNTVVRTPYILKYDLDGIPDATDVDIKKAINDKKLLYYLYKSIANVIYL